MAFGASRFNQATLYAFRYIVGYGFLIGLLLFIVTVDIGNIPNGLSQAEMSQAVSSNAIHFSWDFGWIINGIYNFIQQLAVEAFGLSRLSLIVPSLIFGTMTIVTFTLTIRHWFRESVAIVATAIVATSVPFVSMLRSGTPDIMVPFWTILLLYGAVRLLVKRDKAFGWKLLIVLASVGLLCTPYGIYPLVITFSSALFHPHVRSRVRHIKPHRIVLLVGVAAMGVAPLVIHLIMTPSSLSTLVGSEMIQGFFVHPRQNIAAFYDMYLHVQKSGFSGTILVPVFNIASLSLMVLGVLRSLKDRFTARSYVLLPWALLTLLTAIVAPTLNVLVLVPASLLIAIGIDTLIVEWYSLFPRNPYARVAGLIPLTILFIGISLGNISHDLNNYAYITNPFYTQSLQAIQSSLVIEGNHSVTLVTSPSELAFYSILKKEHGLLKVTTSAPKEVTEPVFVIPNSKVSYAAVPSRILTSEYKDNSVTLRIYRPQ